MESDSKCTKRSFETNCVHLDGEQRDGKNFGAISYPIYQTATFAHKGIGGDTGYTYSRLQNPTREHLEKIVATLEGGTDALALSTGMAAVSLVMELFSPGDHIIADSDLYGGSTRLFTNISEKNGLHFSRINCAEDDVEAYVTPETKAIFVETPTNPMMRISDIPKLADIAHSHGAWLIVDNTFMTPYLMNPLRLGADIVIHSGTKYLGGHNDTLAGFVVSADEAIDERLRYLYKTTGAVLAPFDSWLLLRGIKTLPLRMDRAQENAMALAEWLREQPIVTEVLYPGLEEHPGHELLARMANGFGAMITFKVTDRDTALKVLEKTELIAFAESLGGVETLMTYPVTQTHADVPEEERLRNGLTDATLRLSCGIENVNDLIADLSQAFNQIIEERGQ